MNKEVEPSFSYFGQPAAMAYFFCGASSVLEWMEEEEKEEETCEEEKNCDGNKP